MPQQRTHASHAQRQAAYRRRCQEARQRQLQEKGLPALPAIPAIPGTARWRAAITNAADLLAMVEEEMQSYYDDRSEQWQESNRADDFEERRDAVADARSVVADLLMT
jgi:hypothetical protein